MCGAAEAAPLQDEVKTMPLPQQLKHCATQEHNIPKNAGRPVSWLLAWIRAAGVSALRDVALARLAV